ncbi:tyrosine recombinase XerC [Paenibacillus sp. YSY-4.3]
MSYKDRRAMILEQREAKEDLDMISAINMFLFSRKVKNLSEGTFSFYKQTLNDFSNFLSSLEVLKPSEVILEDIQEYIRGRSEKGNSVPTINKYIRSLRAFFNYLCSSGYLRENPMEAVDKLVEEKRVLRTLSRDQVRTLLNIPNQGTPAGYRNYVFMLLLLDTGVRLEEALSVRLPDIFWEERVIQVFGKGRRERIVPFSEMLAAYLYEYIGIRGDLGHDVLFVNVEGQPLKRRTIQEDISNYAAKAGIDGVRVSSHSLRYTFARNYLLNGGDVVSLMKIMGHKSLAMAQLYAEMFQPDIARQHAKYSPAMSIFAK